VGVPIGMVLILIAFIIMIVKTVRKPLKDVSERMQKENKVFQILNSFICLYSYFKAYTIHFLFYFESSNCQFKLIFPQQEIT